jgi:hypothetical protein
MPMLVCMHDRHDPPVLHCILAIVHTVMGTMPVRTELRGRLHLKHDIYSLPAVETLVLLTSH